MRRIPRLFQIPISFLIVVLFLLLATACSSAPAAAPVLPSATSMPGAMLLPTATALPSATPTPAPSPTVALPTAVAQEQLRVDGSRLVWQSPDGREVALDTGAADELLSDFSVQSGGADVLAAYQRMDGSYRLRLLRLDSGEAFDLYRGATRLERYILSGDRQRLGYFLGAPGALHYDVYVVEAVEGAIPRQVGATQNSEQGYAYIYDAIPFWLPDSRTLVWSDDRGLWAAREGETGVRLSDQSLAAWENSHPGGRYTFLTLNEPPYGECYRKLILDWETLAVHEIPGGRACGSGALVQLAEEIRWRVEEDTLEVVDYTPAEMVWRVEQSAGRTVLVEDGPAGPGLSQPAAPALTIVDNALVRADPQTGEQTVVVPARSETLARFEASPDERWLALVYLTPGDGTFILELRDSKSGVSRLLYQTHAEFAYNILDLAFSADGQWLAFIPVNEQTAGTSGRGRGLAKSILPAPLAGGSYYLPIYLARTDQPEILYPAGFWATGASNPGSESFFIEGAPYHILAWRGKTDLLWCDFLPYEINRLDVLQIKQTPDSPPAVDGWSIQGEAYWPAEINLGAASPDGRYLIVRSGTPAIIDLQERQVVLLPEADYSPSYIQTGGEDPAGLPLPVWLPDGRLLVTTPGGALHTYLLDPDSPAFFVEVP